jgi:CubicO group peptidase (beta-lactamase class C family)
MVSRILCLVVIVGGGHPAASLAQEPPSFAEVVQPYVDRGQMAGASGVVVTPTSVLTFPTVGYADLESKRPMREDTLFWMASTSKPVHATAVMMLVDDGKLKLDDPVSKYLPDFKPRLGVTDADGKQRLRAPEHAITVRMLLNHTSGLEFSDPAARMPPADCCSLTELVARFVSLPLLFEPGTKFAYSDAGPDTACRIVEVISGQDFETFIRARLFAPLGMKDTTYFPTREQLARLATVYWFSPKEHRLVLAPQQVFLTLPYDDRRIRHAPGGGLFSTGNDLARFARMFLNNGVLDGHRYLSETSVAAMTRSQLSAEVAASIPQPPGSGPDVPASYGLGWGVGASGAYFHPGAASTNIRVDPTRGYATIFLPQQAPDATVLEMYRKLDEAARQHWDARATP